MVHSRPKSKMRKKLWANRSKQANSPQAFDGRITESVNIYLSHEGQDLPLIIESKIKTLELNIWANNHRDFIEKMLLKHGGILFRCFRVETEADFELFIDAVIKKVMKYMEGATPRTKINEKISTSTEFPPDQKIFLHNESSYVKVWPGKIAFFCHTPPGEGGQTPIADVRKIFKRLNPRITEKFSEKGWLLTRNYGFGFGLPWQDAFHMEEPNELNRYCREFDIELEWVGADRIHTRQIRPAIAKHPITRESLWFNHIAFWHSSSLPEESRALFQSGSTEKLAPYNTYYGDGAPIEDSVIDEIREAYERETIVFSWKKGDVLFLDNMLVAHGRNPFSGPRKILVAMGEPVNRP